MFLYEFHFIIAGALCLCILKGSSFFTSSFMSQKRARQTMNDSGVTKFFCDVTDCTFEANSSSSLKRHKVSHSAALLLCDFTGCFYETIDSSHLKRHKLNQHTTVFKCDFNECHLETNTEPKLKRHTV